MHSSLGYTNRSVQPLVTWIQGLLLAVVFLTSNSNSWAQTTSGSSLVDRVNDDGAAAQVYIFSQPSGAVGTTSTFSFFDNEGGSRKVTPLIFEKLSATQFVLRGVGASVTTNGMGVQSFPFTLLAGTNVMAANYTFGFTDREVSYGGSGSAITTTASYTGTVDWDYTAPTEWLFTPSLTFELSLGQAYDVGGLLFAGETRTYSAQISITAAPTVISISPTSGSTTGGTSVTINGTNFTGATGVTIGGTAATSVSVVNATTITCTTPAGSAGTASVVVTTPGGSNAANALFTYVPPPDYIVTTTGNAIVITDSTGNGDTLSISEPSAGNIQFAAAGRNFSVDGGANIAGNSGSLSRAGVTSITVNAAAGTDSINVGAFTGTNFPSLTLNGGTGNDTVNLNGDITFAANANLDVDLQNDDATPGADQIVIGAGTDLITSGSGAITMKASTTVNMTAGSGTLRTENGDITLEGNQQATPQPGAFYGVVLGGLGARLVEATGSGNIVMKGRGGVSGTFGVGIAIEPATVRTNTGNITMVGTGAQSAANLGSGIQLGFGTVESTGGGSIDLTGTGAGTGLRGKGINFAGFVRTTGAGAITLTGTGSSTGSGSENYGVDLHDDTAVTIDGSGLLTVNATGGANASPAFHTATGTNLMGYDGVNAYSGNIIVNADSMSIANAVIRTTGTATLRQKTNGTMINLGAADSAGLLGLTDAELDQVTAGTVVIGDANSGTITTSAAITHPNNLSLITGVGLTVNQALTMAANKSLTFSGVSTVSVGAAITATGTGAISLTTARNVSLTSTISTVNGNLTLSANQQGTPASGNFVGVDVNNGLVQATGTGVVTVLGKGGNSGNDQVGVRVQAGGDIIGGTSGTLTVTGTGGASTGTANAGINVNGSGSTISALGAHVQVTGSGGGGTYSIGLDLYSSPQITSTGSGNLTIIGNGGLNPAAGAFNHGIIMGSTTFSSAGGNVSVTGTAGSGSNASGDFTGIQMDDSTITSGGSGTVTVNATAGTAATSQTTIGLDIRFTSQITSSGGDVTVTATGGNTPSTTIGAGAGVRLIGNGTITAGGSGSVTVTGSGVAGGGTGHEGIVINGYGFNSNLARIGGSNGATTINAVAGNTSSHALVVGTVNAGRITTGTNNPITINADSINFGGSALVSSGTATTTINTRTTGTLINLGGADVLSGSPLTLGLTDAELDKITAGTLIIGSADSGAITISAAISPASYATLDIQKGVAFSAIGGFESDVASATFFEKIRANGAVAINTSATLTATAIGGFVPAASDAFLILENTSASATTGSFSGKPEGFVTSVGGVPKLITYAGGSGNDIVLLGNTPPAITSNGGGAAGSVNVAENTTAVTTVTAADADLPAQTLLYSISGGADQSLFSIGSSSGVLTFNAAPNFEAPADANLDNDYVVTVSVTDNGAGTLSDSQTLTVTLTNVNDAPIAVADAFATPTDIARTISAADLVANDTDQDGNTLTVTSVQSPTNGASVSLSAGVITYTPAAAFTGTATFAYSISDGAGGTANGTVTMTVNASAPVVLNDSTLEITAPTTISNPVTLAGTGGLSTDQPVTLDGAVTVMGTPTISTTNTVTINGAIDGDGQLEKTGSGTLNLTAAGTFTGGFKASEGEVGIGNDAALGTGTVTLGGATVNAMTETRVLENPVDLTGNTTVKGEGLGLAGPVTVDGVRTLTTEGNVDVDGTIQGGAITKLGGGDLILAGNNTFSGGVTTKEGTLGIASDGALGTGPLNLAGGNLEAIDEPRTVSNPVAVSASTKVSGEAVALNGPTTISGSPVITTESDVTLGGKVDSGSAAVEATLIKEGPAELTLAPESQVNVPIEVLDGAVNDLGVATAEIVVTNSEAPSPPSDDGLFGSQAIVQGRSAMSYYDVTNGDLKYQIASNAEATLFERAVVVDSTGEVGQFTSLFVVNGNPAISYYDKTNGNLKYVRANDAMGTIWGTPVTVAASGDVGQYTSMVVVGGQPAITYYDQTARDLMYVRASDANGAAWGTPVRVQSKNDAGKFASMQVVAGNPAIAYFDETRDDLLFIRASDANGTTWPVIPQKVASQGNIGRYASLCVVNGNPAISCYDETVNKKNKNGTARHLCYTRAGNTTGTAWPKPKVVDDSSANIGSHTALQVVNGHPAISYLDATNKSVKYAWATDASGATWPGANAVVVHKIGSGPNSNTSLQVVNGLPGVTFYDPLTEDIEFKGFAEVPVKAKSASAKQRILDRGGRKTSAKKAPKAGKKGGKPVKKKPVKKGKNNKGKKSKKAPKPGVKPGKTKLSSKVGGSKLPGAKNQREALVRNLGKKNMSKSPKSKNRLGSSPGLIEEAEDITWEAGVNIEWDINDALGMPGLNWDSSKIGGSLDIIAGSDDPIFLELVSLQPDNTPGTLVNFNPYVTQTWKLASTGEGITGFVADKFFINADDFTNDLQGGTFALVQSGNDLNIVFTPGTISAPEITVEVAAVPLTTGGAPVNLGSIGAGTSTTRTFTIRNDGVAALTGITIGQGSILVGDDLVELDFDVPDVNTLAPGASLTFDATLVNNQAGADPAAASFVIESNDGDEGIFTVTLTANSAVIPEPEIAIVKDAGAVNLADGSPTAVDFGTVSTGAVTTVSLTITNSGTADLNGVDYIIDGAHSIDFRVLAPPADTIAPGQTAAMVIEFEPSASGVRTAAIHVSSNDGDESPFDILLTGIGDAVPEIAVSAGNIELTDASATPVDFGIVSVNSSQDVTFTISNVGALDLTGLTVNKDGADAAQFSISSPLAVSSLVGSTTTTFTVRFAPTSGGVKTAALHFPSNDANENPFDILITGEGAVAPEIAVEYVGTNLTSGDTVDAGAIAVGNMADLVFTLKNVGSANLTGLAVSIGGTNAADFSVFTAPAASLAGPAGSTTFTVRFVPSLSGPKSATLQIANNDSDESPFLIRLSSITDYEIQSGTPGSTLAGNLGLNKTGGGAATLTGDNTFTGSTNVLGGTLTLNGTAGGNSALPTDGISGNTDITINGGSLLIGSDEQIGNNAGVVLTTGSFGFSGSGLTETIGAFTNNGGTFNTGANTLIGTGNTIIWAAGTNTINAGGTLADTHYSVTGGTNTVEGGATRGTLHVQGGGLGLEFDGTGSPTITLNSDAAQAGRILLEGNVNVLAGLTSGTAQILNGGAASNSGFIDMNGGTRTFSVADGSAATDLLISALVTNGALTKDGAGTLELTGANTYSGNVLVNGGVLKIGNPNAFGSFNTAVGKVTVASGATVDFGGVIDATYGYTISGSGVGGAGALVNTGVAIDNGHRQASNILLAADASIGGTGDWALLANAYGPTQLDLAGHTLTKVGSNTITLVNSTVTAGSISINSGVLATAQTASTAASTAFTLADVAGVALNLGVDLSAGSLAGGGSTGGNVGLNGGSLTVGGLGTSTTYSGVISGTGALTKTGAGTLTLTGANTYTGATTISGGTLKAGSASAFTNKGALQMSGSGVLDLGGFAVGFTDASASATTNTITNNGSANATLNFSNLNTQISSLIQDGTRTLAVSFGNNNSASNLFKLDSANTFSGGVTLLNGSGLGSRLRISNLVTTVGPAGAIVSSPFGTGAITIGQVATDKAGILFDTTASNTLANAIVFNTALGTDFPGIRVDTAATGLVLSGQVTANLANATFSTNGGATVNLTGQVTGAFGLETNASAIAVTLNNAADNNDYAGNTLTGATSFLNLGRANQIPNGATKGNVVNAGTLNLNGFSETINGLSGAGTIDGVSGTPTLTIGDNDASSTYSGVIRNTAGTLALTKTGAGTMTLDGTAANTYTGTTTVNGGVLVLNKTGAGSESTIAAGGSVVINSGGTLRLGTQGQISDSITSFSINGGTFDMQTFTEGMDPQIVLTSGSITGGNTGFLLARGGYAGSGTNTISKRLSVRAADANSGLFDITGGTTTVSGIIHTDSGGAAGIQKTGAGTLVLSGTNTYAGNTTLAAGTLSINASGALGSGLSVTLGVASTSSGNLTYTGGAGSINKNISALGNGTDTIENAGSGLLTLSGTITKDGTTLTLKGGANGISVTGAIGGTSANSDLIIDGGTVTLATANSYNGPTFIRNSGTLNANAANALPTANGRTAVTFDGAGTSVLSLGSNQTVASLTSVGAATVTLNANILTLGETAGSTTFAGSIGGTGGLTKDRASTQILSGSNGYSGTTTISAGTLSITGDINSSTTLAINGGELTTSGADKLADTAAVTVGGGTLTIGGNDTVGSLTLTSGTIGGTATLTAATYGLQGGFVNGDLGTGILTKSTGGSVTLNGTTAATTVNITAGTLTLGNASRLADTAAVNLTGGTLAIGGNSDTVGAVTLTSGSITGSGGVLTGASYAVEAGSISAILGGTGALTKTTGGTVILSGANTYSGTTTVSNGTLSITGSINSSATIAVNGGLLSTNGADKLADAAAVTVGGGTLTIGGSDTVGSLVLTSGTIGGTATLTAATYGLQGGFVNGSLGAGILTKSTGGTVTLSGTAAATTVDISGGTLTLGTNERLDNGATVTVSGTGILNVDAFAETVNAFNMSAGSLDGTGTLTAGTYGLSGGTVTANLGTGTINSSGTVALNGTAGATTVNITGGTLTLGSADRLADGASVSITGGGTLAIGTFNDTVGAVSLTSGSITGSGGVLTSASTYSVASGSVSAILGGSVGLTKTAGGTVTLSGVNTYTGATTISQGTLALSGSGALADSSAVNVNGATGIFDISGISGAGETIGSLAGVVSSSVVLGTKNLTAGADGTSTIFAGAISGTGSLTKAGTGTLTLNSANGYTGLTTVSAGILNIQNATGLGTTAGGTSVSNGATLQLQGGITVGAEALTLNGGAATGQNGALVNVSGTNSFGGAITVAASSSISAAGGSVLNLTGGLDKNGTVLTLTGGGTINVSTVGISGALANSDLVVDGVTVNLDVANTYNGPTFIRNTGTLNANVAGALPTATRTALTFDGAGTSILTLGADQSVASLTSTGAATVTLNANTLTIGAASGSTTFAGSIGGTGGLTKDGASTQVLSGSNGYTGATTISAGTLALSGSGELSDSTAVNLSGATGIFDISAISAGGETIASLAGVGGSGVVLGGKTLTSGGNNSSTTFAGVVSGTGGSLIKNGSGALTLSGANTYTGTTTINTGGTLNINHATAIGTGALVVGGTATIDNTSGAAIVLSNNNALNLSGASLTFTGTNNLSFGTGTLTISSANRTVNTTGGVLTIGSIDAAATNLSFTKAGSGGTLVITGAAGANFQGGFVNDDGVVIIGDKEALGTGPLVMRGGILQASTDLSGGNALTVSSWVLAAGGATFSGNNSITIGNSTVGIDADRSITNDLAATKTLSFGSFNISSDAINRTLTVTGSGDTAFTGVVSNGNSTASNLLKSGTGKLTLSAANTYAGATTISAGTLELTTGGSLSDSTAVNLTGATGVFDISAITATGETIGSLAGVASSSVVLGGKNLTAGGDGSTTTFSGVLTGSGGSLTKTGTGALNLGGANTYTGTTTVSAGTLRLTGSGQISDSSSVVVSGGTFNIGTISDTVSGVQLTSGSISGSSGVLTSTSTYDVQSGSVSAILGGTVGLTKTTAGTVTLSGTNTYTGATQLSAGDLVVDGSIGSSSLATIDGGTLRGTGTVGAIQLNSGGAINPAGITTTGTLNTGNIAIVDGQLRFNIGGTGNHDQINTTGTINLAAGGTGAKLVLDAISGYNATLNNAFTLVSNNLTDAIMGEFAKGTFGGTKVVTISGLDYVENVLGSNFYGRINYAGSSAAPGTLATAGNDIVLKIVTPEITVTEGATTLSDNGGYNFGDVDKVVPAAPLTKTFTIKNDGEVDLMNIAITPITGAAMADYILNTTGTATNLIPGASTTFTVTFDPQRIGTRNAYFSITSNDLNEATFDIPLTGVGSIARDVLDGWTIVYGGVDAPGTTRNGSANAVAVQKRADRDEALAVFATGYTTNPAGNTDVYTAKYEPLTGALQWEVIFDGTARGTDEGYAIAVDGNGDVVITGYTQNGFGNADVYVAKYAGADGTLLWQKIYGGPGQKADVGNSIVVDAANNVAVAGYGENIGTDFFAARYSAAGTTYFERLIDGGSYYYADKANAVAVDAAGNLAVAGYSKNSTNSHKDFRVIKLDAISGATLWQYNANGSSSTDEEAYDVGFNSAGQLFATGTLRSSNYDLYTVKLDVSGGVLWQKQWNSAFDSSDAGLDLAVDTNGDVVVGGASYRAPSVQDGYVVKYRGTDGSIVWDRRFNETAGLQDVIAAVDLDALNNVVATGYSQNADLTYDVLTAKMFASDGGLVWSQRYHGTANKNDSAGAVAVSPDGNVYVAGYSTAASDTTDFLVKNYQAIVPVVQAAQVITFNNPGAQNAGTSLKLIATASSGLTVSFTVLSGPASIDEQDNTLLNFSGTGMVVVRAGQRGNSVTAAAPSVNQSFMVNKSNQTISFSLPASVPYTSNTVVLGAAATSGLPVTYGLVSGLGVINGNVLSFSGPGPVEISADQAGDARFNAAAQVTSTINAMNTPPVIIPNNVEEGWSRTYAGSGATEGRAVALEISGGSSIASFVAGSATNGAGNKDIYLMKFDNLGVASWAAPVIIDGTGQGNDEALSAAVDTSGNVYISGYTTVGAGNTDVYVAKFNGATGANMWTKTFFGTAGGADSAVSLALQGADVVIGGSLTNTGTGVDFFGAKLNQSDGNGGWNVSVNAGGTDYASAVAVGSDGNVVLAGYASNDAYTVQLASATGSANWSRRYNALSKADAVRDVAIDANNDVVITAYSQAANYNIYTAKYSRLDGSIVWEQTYNSSFNSSDAPYALAIDPNGNIIVAGTSYTAASTPDSITIKYDGGAGTQVWERRYAGPDGKADEHFAVEVDVNGNAVVTGYSRNTDNTSDIYTAKLASATGIPMWEERFNGVANGNDAGRAVAADPTGRAWVAGYQSNASSVTELLLLKYQPIGAPPPPLPAPPPLAGDGEFLAFAPPPPSELQMFMQVEHGDTARFAAGFYDAEGNETVDFTAVMDGIPVGAVQVDTESGNFEWASETSSFAPGPHEVVITATDTGGESTTLRLGVTVNSNHPDRTWRWKNFGSTIASGDAADDADPDRDGLTNLAEFAFGLDPTKTGSDAGTRAEAGTGEPGSGMRAVFRRRKDHLTAGLQYIVEFSSNLGDWTPSSEIPAFVADEGDVERVSLQFPILPNGQPGRFFRVRVEQQDIGQ